MAKLTEKQLYETWLDISFAKELNENVLHDLEMEIKIFRKRRNKLKRSLEKATDHYKSIYKSEPKRHKK